MLSLSKANKHTVGQTAEKAPSMTPPYNQPSKAIIMESEARKYRALPTTAGAVNS